MTDFIYHGDGIFLSGITYIISQDNYNFNSKFMMKINSFKTPSFDSFFRQINLLQIKKYFHLQSIFLKINII